MSVKRSAVLMVGTACCTHPILIWKPFDERKITAFGHLGFELVLELTCQILSDLTVNVV